MKQIKIFGLLFCIILAGCATSGPKPESADKPLEPEKIEKAETPQTTTPTTPTTTPGTTSKNDPYGGRSLPYGMSYGMSKAEVTSILTRETGGDPKTQGEKLIWSGIIVQKPRIVVVLAAVFENGKLFSFDIAQFGKKSEETFKRIESGFNKKLNELKANYTIRDSQIAQYRRAVLFQTPEGHFLVLMLQSDDKNNLYITSLRHLEKLPEK
jgi:hypothetical protein